MLLIKKRKAEFVRRLLESTNNVIYYDKEKTMVHDYNDKLVNALLEIINTKEEDYDKISNSIRDLQVYYKSLKDGEDTSSSRLLYIHLQDQPFRNYDI